MKLSYNLAIEGIGLARVAHITFTLINAFNIFGFTIKTIRTSNYLTGQSSFAISNWIDQNIETVVIDDDSFERELCKGKGGEWFRLQAGEDNCRDVIQCTTSVS